MFDGCTLAHETIEVCPVEAGGVTLALAEGDVMGVLPLDGDAELAEIGGLLALELDPKFQPMISLRAALCLPPSPAETVVVVLRVGVQLFGLLVDQAHAPSRAVVRPVLDAPSARATFSHLVGLDDGEDVPLLNLASLVASAQAARARCLAA